MDKFSYKGFFKLKIIFSQIVGTIGIVLFSAVSLFLLFSTNRVQHSETVDFMHDPRVTLICLAVWTLIICWEVGSTLINYFPTIWLSENEMWISAFLFFHISIPWSNIIDIGKGHPPYGTVLVRAQKITIFHRIFGWFYSFTFYPGFLIGSKIEKRDELIQEIRNKIRAMQVDKKS